MTTAADGSQVPSQVTSGYVQDTSDEVPVTQAAGTPMNDPGTALRDPNAAELNKLHTYLMTAYPQEMTRSNVVKQESPVDVAIRLLSGFGVVTGSNRCPAEYCNLPANHDGDHGFISYTPR